MTCVSLCPSLMGHHAWLLSHSSVVREDVPTLYAAMTWLFPSPHLGWVYTVALFLSNLTSTFRKLGLKPLLGSCVVWVYSIARRCPVCSNTGGLSSVISLEDLISLKSRTVLCTDQTLIIHTVDDLGKLLHLVWSLFSKSSFQTHVGTHTRVYHTEPEVSYTSLSFICKTV